MGPVLEHPLIDREQQRCPFWVTIDSDQLPGLDVDRILDQDLCHHLDFGIYHLASSELVGA